jgi:hypothetical protein
MGRGGSEGIGGSAGANGAGGSGGSAGSPADAAGGSACVTTKDCEAGYECAYAVAEGCSAKGQCLPQEKLPMCKCLVAVCTCNGQAGSVGEPNPCCGPYAGEPIAHLGTCGDATP